MEYALIKAGRIEQIICCRCRVSACHFKTNGITSHKLMGMGQRLRPALQSLR